jgi:hypothetical protein
MLESAASRWFTHAMAMFFYLRALLLHRSARDWVDIRTIDGVSYGTYQEAASAMGLFDNRDEGIMVFEELPNFGAPPAHLRWIFAILAAEGSPALIIWEAHKESLGADIRDRMLRTSLSTARFGHKRALASTPNFVTRFGQVTRGNRTSRTN